MAKRRRSNGSLEEGLPLAGIGPPGYETGSDDAEPFDPTHTEILEEPPPPPSARPVPNPVSAALPSREESPSRRGSIPEERPIGDAALAPPEALPMSPLELRIRRLEDALAQLQATRTPAEARIVTSQPARPVPVATPAPTLQAPTDRLWEMGKRVLSAPVEAARNLRTPPGLIANRPGWLLLESIAEARAILRMFTDPRYRLTWTCRIAPPLLVVAIVISGWVPFTGVPFIGLFLNKSIDLVLAFFLFKVLGHEARRYRETAPDLPPSLRL